LDTLLITDAFGNERAIIYIGGRMKRYYKISCFESKLVLLDTLLITDAFGNERAIIYIGGRMKRYYKISYDDKEGFPVLPHGDRLSELYLLQAHRVDHGEINTMVMMSRKKVCIMQAAMIKNACFRCRLL
jgi:hypothetical protein